MRGKEIGGEGKAVRENAKNGINGMIGMRRGAITWGIPRLFPRLSAINLPPATHTDKIK
jgi:hypothetical protein